ncbi:MAG: preprotein translocase subunit SecY [Christensenellaceae bacterium]|jgi:preprotein translocase subunit SecY|nr:preprotein translocase subunit SecY [Christensenellaceae bacterium]
MWKTIKEAFVNKDLRNKILVTLLCLFIYRLGCYIPIPGIDPATFNTKAGENDFLSLLSDVSGGALSKGALLSLGVGPYITSSIVIQLLTLAIPAIERLSKQGSDGRKKLAQITRYIALLLGIAQATAIVLSFDMTSAETLFWKGAPGWLLQAMVVLTLVAGSMFTVWLGEKITELGVSNGMSMIVFIGILSTGVTSLVASIGAAIDNIELLATPIVFLVMLAMIFAIIVFFDLAERRIPVTYAKQIKGNKMYGGQSSNIPVRINANGVMPIIFAISLINFPQLIMSFWPTSDAFIWYSKWMGTGTWLNISITALLILAFNYFYATMSFNPKDISLQIQRNGGFILGYRPGKPTEDYLKKVSHRITLFGALFLMFVALIPSLIFKGVLGEGDVLNNAFTSIGMLIIVSVALEIDKQLQAQMLMKEYKGFLK